MGEVEYRQIGKRAATSGNMILVTPLRLAAMVFSCHTNSQFNCTSLYLIVHGQWTDRAC